jgi:H+-transporting ATPase
MSSLESLEQVNYLPFDPTVKRTEGTIRNNITGEEFKTTKGAPHIIQKLIDDFAVINVLEKDIKSLGEKGIRSLAVAKTNEKGEWKLLGLLTFLDVIFLLLILFLFL